MAKKKEVSTLQFIFSVVTVSMTMIHLLQRVLDWFDRLDGQE